jgi:hypothetical protein
LAYADADPSVAATYPVPRLDRLRQLPLLDLHDADPEQRVAVLRVELQGLAVLAHRLVEVALALGELAGGAVGVGRDRHLLAGLEVVPRGDPAVLRATLPSGRLAPGFGGPPHPATAPPTSSTTAAANPRETEKRSVT